jgi:hypothetical protein
MVKGVSTGLQFLYEEMEGSERVWSLDSIRGILHFNTRHPLWAECEPKDTVLMRFQEHVAIMALTLEAAPEGWRDQCRKVFDDSLPATVFALTNADSIAGRLPGRKTGVAAKIKK